MNLDPGAACPVSCPARAGGPAPLVVQATEGGILFHCSAGCRPEKILGRLGVEIVERSDEERKTR